MSVIADLKQLSSAEEFFDYLEVDYDPAVLNVARLHILKRLGGLLKQEAPPGSLGETEDEVRARYRAHLERAYEELAHHGPMEQRLFKVHQDAVKAKGQSAFVPLASIAPGAEDGSGEPH